MFSYHPNRVNLGDGRFYAKNWHVNIDDSVHSIARAITKLCTSPIVFTQGRRAIANYFSAHWIGLDFDDGPSVDEMLNTLGDHIHILGTTKSHRLPKGHKPACDRFRLWLRLPEPLIKAEDYKATVSHYVRLYEADEACIDSARFFWPCKEIISLSPEGFTADIKRGEKKNYSPLKAGYSGRIPYWVREWLEKGVPVGTRSKHAFRTACLLSGNGFTQEEIVAIILDSALMAGEDPLTEQNVRDSVRSGATKAVKEMGRPPAARGVAESVRSSRVSKT